MRRAHLALVLAALLLGSASPLRAQLQVEGHLSASTQSLRLLSKIPGENATEFTGSATAFDVLAFAPRYRAGLQVQRSAAGASAPNAGTYRMIAITALVGRPSLAAEVGLASRTGYSDQTDRDLEATYRFYRLGGRLTAPLGTTGFSVGARASVYAPADGDSRDGATGMDAGTQLRWTAARLPLTAVLEYRSERFTVARGVHQELSVVSLGVGLAFRSAP